MSHACLRVLVNCEDTASADHLGFVAWATFVTQGRLYTVQQVVFFPLPSERSCKRWSTKMMLSELLCKASFGLASLLALAWFSFSALLPPAFQHPFHDMIALVWLHNTTSIYRLRWLWMSSLSFADACGSIWSGARVTTQLWMQI